MSKLSWPHDDQLSSQETQFCFLAIFVRSLIALLFATQRLSAAPADTAEKQGLKPILNYISQAWDTLTRSMTSCESIVDPKIADDSGACICLRDWKSRARCRN